MPQLLAAFVVFVVTITILTIPFIESLGISLESAWLILSGSPDTFVRGAAFTGETFLVVAAFVFIMVVGCLREHDNLGLCLVDTLGLVALASFAIHEGQRMFGS